MSKYATMPESESRGSAYDSYDLLGTLQHYEVKELSILELGKLMAEIAPSSAAVLQHAWSMPGNAQRDAA